MRRHQRWPRVVESGTVELCIHPQRVERDDNMAVKEFGELAKVRRRGYVRVVEVKILTHYLLVTKGEDIRMVYNVNYQYGIPTLRYLWLDPLSVL